jgi:hypothetical protein
MKCRNGAAGFGIDSLVEGVENIGGGRSVEQAPEGVFRERIVKRSQETVRAVTEAKLFKRMGAGEAEQEFARIHSDAR